jgi:hypothetical protein
VRRCLIVYDSHDRVQLPAFAHSFWGGKDKSEPAPPLAAVKTQDEGDELALVDDANGSPGISLTLTPSGTTKVNTFRSPLMLSLRSAPFTPAP